MKTLPNALSELILVSLDDMESFLATSPKNEIHMAIWAQKTPKGCRASVAGTVMIQSLQIQPHYSPNLHPLDLKLDQLTSHKLYALDYIRSGLVKLAYETLSEVLVLPEFTSALPDRVFIPEYSLSPSEWHSAMLNLAEQLNSFGL